MPAQWKRYPSAQAAAQASAAYITGLLNQTLSTKEQATLAVSGGSTPKLLFAELVKADLPWKKIHLFWVDERAVPPADSESNFRLAQEALIAPGNLPEASVHRIQGESPPEIAARCYVTEIRGFFGLPADRLPEFDLVQLGMGPDAHTASLFPGEPLIEDRKGIAAAVFTPKLPRWRVTLLPGVLLAAKNIVFLVAGEDKAPAVRSVFEDPYEPRRVPTQLVHREGRNVHWFLDDAAGRELLAFDPHSVK